jgi:hypothetical protein
LLLRRLLAFDVAFGIRRFSLRGVSRDLQAKEASVDLNTAGNYVILAATGISTVPDSVITGDIAVSPIARAAMTGFSMTMDSSNTFSTSAQLTGRAYAADYYAPPTPGLLTVAVEKMVAAYNNAAGRTTSDGARKNLGAGLLGGVKPGGPTTQLTQQGVYTFSTDISITGDLHFRGSGLAAGQGNTDVFISHSDGWDPGTGREL